MVTKDRGRLWSNSSKKILNETAELLSCQCRKKLKSLWAMQTRKMREVFPHEQSAVRSSPVEPNLESPPMEIEPALQELSLEKQVEFNEWPIYIKISPILGLLGLYETMFTFILSKLPLHYVEIIFPEITEMILIGHLNSSHASPFNFSNLHRRVAQFLMERFHLRWNFNKGSSLN